MTESAGTLLSPVEGVQAEAFADRRLTMRNDGKPLAIAALGGMLEYFEFVIYIYLAPQIGMHFSSPEQPAWVGQIQTFSIFAIGYLARPLGGWIFSSIGDTSGRKKTFSLTLAMMAVPTLIIGVLPGYESIGVAAPMLLLTCRVLQGLSVGGELPSALSFVSEHVPPNRLGFACGILAASLSLGALLGSASLNILAHLLGTEQLNDWGWRLLFILGGGFGLLSVYLRRLTGETPVFLAMKAANQLAKRMPIVELFSRHRKTTLLCLLIACANASMATAVIQYPITFFTQTRGLPLSAVLPVHNLMMVTMVLGSVLAGIAADRISLRWAALIGLAGLATCLFFVYAQTDAKSLWIPFAMLGLFNGTMGVTLGLLVLAFPAQIRTTGIAMSYNVPVAVVGGMGPLVLTLLTYQAPLWAAIVPASFCAIAAFATLLVWPHRSQLSTFNNDTTAR